MRISRRSARALTAGIVPLLLVLGAPVLGQEEAPEVEETPVVEEPQPLQEARAQEDAPAAEDAAEAAAEAVQVERSINPFQVPRDHEAAGVVLEASRDRLDTLLRALAQEDYRRERSIMMGTYATEIANRREDERAMRAMAIHDFEVFLERYPEHPRYTPDVIFRLADLHYEEAIDRFNQADAVYQEALDRAGDDMDALLPDEPRRDFASTIALFERLLRDYPDYRQIDGALYLLAICLEQSERYDESLVRYHELVDTWPDSSFAQESWLRIGERHFERDAFAQAREAYLEALRYGESVWFDKVLFKLGWAYYLLGEYDPGIRAFERLLLYYDSTGQGAIALEEEALQYFAISIAEEDWDLDGERDADFVMARIFTYLYDDAPYVGRVLTRLTAILMDRQLYEDVLEINTYGNSRYICAEGNLDRSLQSVEALTALRRTDEAILLQREIARDFGPGSRWYRCMQDEGQTERLAQAESVVRDSLIETAALYYNTAQATREEALASGDQLLLVQSETEFSFAADIYADFLASYADDETALEMRLYFAQALLLSTRFEEAATQFGLVRDAPDAEEYQELAAALSIQAWEEALDREIDAYALEGRAWPAYDGPNEWVSVSAADFDPMAPREREGEGDPLPELSQSWAHAIDRYLELELSSEDDPLQAFRYGFQVGKLYYDYRHYVPAVERFLIVLDRCDPEAPESGFAAGYLLNSYQAQGDVTGVSAFEEALSGRYERCIAPDILAELRRDVGRIGGGILARSAEDLFDAGDYLGAAEEYARLAEELADDEEFAPIGLFNSGLIYEQQLRRYERAIAQFDHLIERYPDSRFTNDAHVRIAVNAKRFFDFERAITEFRYLDEIGFSDVALVEHPLLDAAQLMESVGQTRAAADAYREWAERYPADSRAPAALYSAGELYDRLGEHRIMREVFEQFRAQYGNDWGEAIDIDAAVIDSYYRSGQAWEAAGNYRLADAEYNRLLQEHAVRLPQAVQANYAAAQIVYERAEQDFNEWNQIALGETVQSQQRGLQQRIEGITDLVYGFRDVEGFTSAEWTVCAYYMEGRVFQVMADLLYQLPMPDFGDDQDAEDEFLNTVESFAQQYEDQAIAAWETAYPAMSVLGVNNRCTVDLTAQLNQYRGADYPVFRDAIEYEAVDLASPPGLLLPPEASAGAVPALPVPQSEPTTGARDEEAPW